MRKELNDWRGRAGVSRIEEPERGEGFQVVLSGEMEILPGIDYQDDRAGSDGRQRDINAQPQQINNNNPPFVSPATCGTHLPSFIAYSPCMPPMIAAPTPSPTSTGGYGLAPHQTGVPLPWEAVQTFLPPDGMLPPGNISRIKMQSNMGRRELSPGRGVHLLL